MFILLRKHKQHFRDKEGTWRLHPELVEGEEFFDLLPTAEYAVFEVENLDGKRPRAAYRGRYDSPSEKVTQPRGAWKADAKGEQIKAGRK